MQEQTIYQVDAFADELFKGNPAAVVPLEQWLDDQIMQAIALENNLSETAFFVEQSDAYQLRWFTPTVEVDLCGHATLASAHVLFQHLNYNKNQIEFFTRSGALKVSRNGDEYLMDFPTDQIKAVKTPTALTESLGIAPEETFIGRDDYLAILKTQEEVAALKPDFQKMKALSGRGLIVSAPGKQVDFVSRGFFPNTGIDEDPVTGSAHTTLTPYWAKRLGKNTLSARQISSRGGALRCTLLGERVVLAGRAITYMKGNIFLL